MKGKDIRLSITDTERCVDCQGCMFACARRQGVAGLTKICIGGRLIGGIDRGRPPGDYGLYRLEGV